MKQAACIYIHNPTTGQVVVTNRRDSTMVGLPGGKVDAGENPRQAAIRELLEETGIDIKIDPYKRVWLIYCAVCKGEVDYETYCYYVEYTGDIPGGIEPGISAGWADPEVLLTNSPFVEYNTALINTISKTRF